MADHMIATYREKGDKWVHQAEKAQRRMYAGVLTKLKSQDASYYLEQAAQCFRIAKRFQDAGVAYKQCGRMEEKLKKPEVAASFYHEAALCFRKDDPQEATACYLSSINLYCQTQLFATAARLEGDVAELMQKDRNRSLAVAHYVKAADFYLANTSCGKATDRCLLKAAYELGLFEKYVEAAALFEEVGRRMLVDELLKFNSPDTFLRAVLCLLCASLMPETTPIPRVKPGAEAPLARPTLNSVKATILSFGKINSVFQGSRAYLFALDMVLVAEEGDFESFAARVYAYNNVCRLDAWYLRILKILAGYVEAKSIKLRKLRAAQDKLRRKQLAAERTRERMKGRQTRAMQDDSSEGTLSRSDASSSEAAFPTDTEATQTQSKPSKVPKDGATSSSFSDAGSGSGSGSVSGSGSGSESASSSSGSSSSSTSNSDSNSSSSGSGSGSGSGSSGSGSGSTSSSISSSRKAGYQNKLSDASKAGVKKKEGSGDASGTESSSLSGESGTEHSKSARAARNKTKATKGSSRSQSSGSESGYSVGGSESAGSRQGSAGIAGKPRSKAPGVKDKKTKRVDGKKNKTGGGGKVKKSVFWRKS